MEMYSVKYECGCEIIHKDPLPRFCKLHDQCKIKDSYKIKDDNQESADPSKVITGSEIEKSCLNCINSWRNSGEKKGCMKEECEGFSHWEYVVSNKQKTGTTEEAKLPHLQKVLETKYNLAVDKNTDYGNSFDKIMDKLVDHNIDPLQGLYIRLADKFNRFETLLFSDAQKVNDESIMDTLRDLSNYVDLYMAWEAKKDDRTT